MLDITSILCRLAVMSVAHYKSKPDKPGIWQWYEDDGTERLVCVYDVGFGLPYLRVFWWGGYYDVHDGGDRLAEWPDRWGEYVGPINSFGDDELYLMPTEEQRLKIDRPNL